MEPREVQGLGASSGIMRFLVPPFGGGGAVRETHMVCAYTQGQSQGATELGEN